MEADLKMICEIYFDIDEKMIQQMIKAIDGCLKWITGTINILKNI